MTKKTGIALVVIAIIAIGGSYMFPKVSTQVIERATGAVSTLDGVDSGFMKIQGQREYRWSQGLTATSSVICALKNPYAATSSIMAISAESVNTGIAQANNLYISTSTTAYGSSTPALVSAFAMGTGQWSVELQKNSATTTAATTAGLGDTSLLPGRAPSGASYYILGPSEWITFRIATTTPGTFATYDQGECSVILKKI